MATSHILTPELLRQLLDYDPETGLLTWKRRGPEWFSDGYRTAQGRANNWNRKWAGKSALNHLYAASGYRSGAVLEVPIQAHRAAYMVYHGVRISGSIDHINGRKEDNRICNLRDVTSQENCRNAALYSSNKSGCPGVMWDQSRRRWDAKINFDGKQRRLGRFKLKADAVAARKAAELEHGYHANHGRKP